MALKGTCGGNWHGLGGCPVVEGVAAPSSPCVNSQAILYCQCQRNLPSEHNHKTIKFIMEAFAARKAQLKGGVSAADARRRRAQNSIKISKNKRMEGLMKRRGGVSSASTAQSNADVIKEAGSLPKDLRVENLQLYFNGTVVARVLRILSRMRLTHSYS